MFIRAKRLIHMSIENDLEPNGGLKRCPMNGLLPDMFNKAGFEQVEDPISKVFIQSGCMRVTPRDSRVAWSILERLGRLDRGSNPRYPIFTKPFTLRAVSYTHLRA